MPGEILARPHIRDRVSHQLASSNNLPTFLPDSKPTRRAMLLTGSFDSNGQTEFGPSYGFLYHLRPDRLEPLSEGLLAHLRS